MSKHSSEWKWERREGRERKQRSKMPVSGRSVFVVRDAINKRAEQARKGCAK